MRERGTQSRRARATEAGTSGRPPPPPRTAGFWPALAIVAMVVAVAGWSTVTVLVLREPAVAEATSDITGDASEPPGASLEPIADSHTFPELEALLPPEVDGTPLVSQSWSGDTLIADDDWSTTLTTFLTSVGKVPADIGFAQAYDPSETAGLDITAGVFELAGVDPAALRDAIIEAWKGDYAELTVTKVTLGGLDVMKGDFGTGQINSYWYIKDGRVFDIGSADETLAAAALAALRLPSASPGASGSPGASSVPSVPESASPS